MLICIYGGIIPVANISAEFLGHIHFACTGWLLMSSSNGLLDLYA